MHKSVPEKDKISTPLFAMNPSRCVQFMNMISPCDLFDKNEVFRVKDDLIAECQKYGDILEMEIPVPAKASANDK
jgi:hypothetical protein